MAALRWGPSVVGFFLSSDPGPAPAPSLQKIDAASARPARLSLENPLPAETCQGVSTPFKTDWLIILIG